MSRDLHTLIRTLSKSERRQFTLAASDPEADYVKLFSILDAQPKYDEDELRSALQEAGLPLRHLHVTKNYLFNAVLRMLRDLESERTVDTRLRAMLNDVTTLRLRQLPGKASVVLRKAKYLAELHGRHTTLIEILGHEEALLPVRSPAEYSKRAQKVQTERRLVMEQLQTYDALFGLHRDLMSEGLRVGLLRSSENLARWKRFNNDWVRGLRMEELDAACFIQYCGFYRLYHAGLGEHRLALKHALAGIERFEARESFRQAHSRRYDLLVYHGFLSAMYAAEFALAEALLQKLRDRPQTPASDVRRIVPKLELELDLVRGDFAHALDREHEMLELIATYAQSNVLITAETKYFLAFAHLFAGTPQKALDYAVQVINERGVDDSFGPYTLAWFVRLIALLALEETATLAHLVPVTKRYFQRIGQFHGVERSVLSMLALVARKPNAREALLSELLDTLRTLREDPLEKPIFDWFPFHLWLQSYLTRIPLQQSIDHSRASSFSRLPSLQT